MSKDDKYSRESWITDEIKEDLRRRDNIVSKQGIKGLFNIKHNSDFSIALHEILMKRHEENPNSLNQSEFNLFLCMHLENAGQADHILSFLQEWFPKYSDEVVTALNEIGAIKSAAIIKQAVGLLPKDGSWFYDSADEKTQKRMDELDSQFSDYPDGFMRDLYRKYADDRRKDFDHDDKSQ